MDASSRVVKPKRQKLVAGGSKSFGNLPNELIERIFSLLPTKDAIRTSVLCKKWEYLWTSFPKLSLCHRFLEGRTAFVNAVERALILHGSADIKQFTLSFLVLEDISRVNLWISAVLRRGIEKLFLGLHSIEGSFTLAPRLFTCATLLDLELNVPYGMKVPSTVCFSSLKRLCLNSVVFSDEYSTQKLFSGCPVLEELSLRNCSWGDLKFVTISPSSSLFSLIIYETINQLLGGCQILVFGVSLKYFQYEGKFLNDFIFYNSSVIRAKIVPTNAGLRHVSYRLYKLLKDFCSLKILTISSSSFEVIQSSALELLAQMPLFSNLATLILEGKLVDIGCRVLLRMLQNCPLQTLVFSEGIGLFSDNAEDDGVLEPLPSCFLTSLKNIELHAFHGNQVELDALNVLLKNAMVLEKMTITFSASFQEELKDFWEFNRQILDLPRGSKFCEIISKLA